VTGNSPIREYAIEQMNQLLTSLAFQVHRAGKLPGPDEIHDVRVSIRRFAQGLILYAGFFPKWEVKKVRKRLKRMMHLTSEIRNRDIALEFLDALKEVHHRRHLVTERLALQRDFARMVTRWTGRDFSSKWRNDLSLRGGV
jgi:CHAD domain-containing protein